MVKKITGSTPSRPTEGTTGVKSTDAVETKNVTGVSRVGQISGKASVERSKKMTRPMTAEERAHLLAVVDEEAEKLFGEHGIPPAKRQLVTTSVKMSIQAGLLSDEEEDV